MFNRGPFNRLPYNRIYMRFVDLSATLDGNGELIASGNFDGLATVSLSGDGSFSVAAIRELFNSFHLDGSGELQVNAIRERFATIVMDASGSLSVNARKYHIDQIQFTGDFNPGDRIGIDSKKLKIVKNGVNVSNLTQLDSFDLNTGINNVTYTDTETGRTVLFRISYRDKFLY